MKTKSSKNEKITKIGKIDEKSKYCGAQIASNAVGACFLSHEFGN